MSEGPELVVRLPNWVGDVCMALPTLWGLHQAGWRCTAVGRGWAPGLLAGCPWPTLSLPRASAEAAKCYRSLGCRDAILLTNSLSSAWAARRGGLRAVGYRGDGRRLLLAAAPKRPAPPHEVHQFFHLAEIAARRLDPRRELAPVAERMHLPLTADAKRHADDALGPVFGDPIGAAIGDDQRPVIVVAPLATGTINGRSKIYPHWAALAQRLQTCDARVVACPGPGEVDACRAAVPGVEILADLDLASFAAVCARAVLVVANDSGPMHLAASVDVPVVGIFGVGDPQRTAPWGGTWVGSATEWPSIDNVWAALAPYLPGGD